MEAIAVADLTVIYPGGVKALDNVSFAVPKGVIVGYLGPNGAGKTTTINVLTTAMRPTSGRAQVCGYDVEGEKQQVRKRIGLATQDVIVDPFISPHENMRFFATIFGVPKQERENRIRELLRDFGLAAKARDKVLTLSGGQWKRLQIAIALLRRPEILFLDEPTLGLDPQGKQTLFRYLHERVDAGTTIFFSSNEMEQLERVCDRVIFLFQGRLVAEGLVKDFIRRFAGGELVSLYHDRGYDLPEGLLEELELTCGLHFESRDPLTWISDDVGKDLPRILSALFAQDVEIKKIEICKPTLNDAFLALIKEKMHGES